MDQPSQGLPYSREVEWMPHTRRYKYNGDCCTPSHQPIRLQVFSSNPLDERPTAPLSSVRNQSQAFPGETNT